MTGLSVWGTQIGFVQLCYFVILPYGHKYDHILVTWMPLNSAQISNLYQKRGSRKRYLPTEENISNFMISGSFFVNSKI